MTRRRALIVAALPVEAQAILSFFEEVHMQSAPTGVSYMTGIRKIFSSPLGEKLKETWTFYIATPSGAGNLEVSRTLERMIPECDPDLVALLGCAGGFPDKIELFDVVAAPRVDYLARSKVAGKVEQRPQQEVASNVFLDHCKNVQLLDLWHQYLLPDVSNAPINVYFEPIISGETVLANSRSSFFRSALAASPKAVAIETEGFGFLSACREHRVEAAVLRGISDMLDDKNRPRDDGKPSNLGPDKAQFKATRHAAALFFATLDFVNEGTFRRGGRRIKAEITEVSIILDAELHDVPEIQQDLFELLKKYGIRNFSFKPANSVRIGFGAQRDAMRIYQALIASGIVKSFGRFEILDFQVKDKDQDDDRLSQLLSRIEALRGSSVDEVLRVMRLENWIETFPLHAGILVDALEYQREQDQKPLRKATRRILHPVENNPDEDGPRRKHLFFGPRTAPSVVITDPAELRAALAGWQPRPAANKSLSWFMGQHLLDRDMPLDALLAHSRQRFFYSWPGLGMVYAACNIPEKAFIDGALAEWDVMRGTSGQSILNMLDHAGDDRLGRRQIREAIAGHPATLSKSFDILTLTGRILSQNDLPVSGCIIPSLYVLTFNGIIAGDGAIERMLLTGMAGDLAEVARRCALPLYAVQSAIRGNTLPFRGAESLALEIAQAMLRNTRLAVAASVLDADEKSQNREAVDLAGAGAKRYLVP
jgi:nucleoside phosphorylase